MICSGYCLSARIENTVMKKSRLVYFVLMALSSCAFASYHLEIETVPVGNAGNVPDPATMYGAVDYEYRIGKFEVTNEEYAKFLNAAAAFSDPYKLYNTKMAESYGGIERSGEEGNYSYSVRVVDGVNRGSWPVNWVTLYNAARFCNWLTTGDTESGVYTLTGGDFSRNEDAWLAGGAALPTVDEWYKAAYYNAALDDGSYFKYSTSGDVLRTNEVNYSASGFGNVTDVFFGAPTSTSDK